MKQFAELFAQLDGSTSTLHKVQALRAYFQMAPAEDAAWAVYFLSGGKPKRTVPTRTLREVALQVSGLPDWLFEESYQAVGDLAETIAHVLPVSPHAQPNAQGLAWWMDWSFGAGFVFGLALPIVMEHWRRRGKIWSNGKQTRRETFTRL